MPVDITQDEMNILNLNGISVEDVKSNIDYLRATGIDDSAIRQQYNETINELKPITKQSANDTGKIKEWKNKGGITPFEYAQNRAIEFNGTYNNIDNNVNFNPVEQALRNSPRNEAVQKKIEENVLQKQERNKRVNEGTASFWDRAGAALDRMGNASYQAQVNAPADPIVRNIIESQNTNDKTGKINFTESLGNSFISGEWIPFIGGFIGGADDKKEREIQEKIRNSQPIRQDELNYLNYRLNKRQEENVRGYTWGGQIADGILPSMIRFSGEIATGQWVLKGLGLMPELAGGATTGQTALYHLGNIAKGGVVNTLLPTGWNDTYQTLQNRLLNNGMEFTDKGSYIFKEATEKPAISFLKSLGQTFVEFASEYSGGLLGMPVKGLSAATAKYIGTPISKYLASQPKLTKFVDKALPELAKRYEILNKLKPQGKTYEFLKDMTRFDGFLEELGEEVVADILNLTLGTGDQERTLENYAKAVFKSPDKWAVLAGAIALQGGTLSVASHVLGNYMERNGASDDEILEVMNSLSETEKEKKISELTTEGLIDVSSYANEDMQQRRELQNRYYTQLKNAGREDDEALQTANVFSEIVANSAKEWGISLDNAEKKFAINLQNMTDEQAYEQYKQDEATLLQGRVEYNNSKIIDDKIDQLFAEYDNLPEDFSDETELNNRVGEMQLLQDIKDGTLADIDKSRAEALISNYEQSEPQLAGALKAALNASVNETTVQPKFQSIETAGAENNQTAVAKKEWETKGTDSRFFKKWFGDSKVVDESGQPLVVYHGTNADFETFDQSKIGTATDMGIWGKGFYFGNKETPYGTKQMPVYLKIDNPFVINDFKTIEEIADYLDVSEFNFRLDSDGPLHFAQDQINQITSHIKEKGHDGIIMRSCNWSEYIVFNPEQIKSVSNQGTFDTGNPNIYYQSAMRKSRSENFRDFYNEVFSKPKNTINKEQFNAITKNGLNIRIPHDTVIHDENRHKLTAEEWQDLLDNIDDVSYAAISKKKSRFGGTPVLLKVDTENNSFGVVVETFAKNNPLISTAFIDTETNIENWIDNNTIKKEAVPNGTKTTFLDISLTNIITDINPKFKSKIINIKPNYQSKNEQRSIDNALGFTYQRFNFDGTAKDNLIVLLNKKADKSTLLHEFAHVYLTTLNNMARENERAKEMLLNVNKWLRYDGIEYTVAQHEKFANGFVAYVRSGKAPTYGLKRAFENFKKWLNDLYSTLANAENFFLDPETEQVFEDLLGGSIHNAQKQEAEQLLYKAKRYAELRFEDEGLKTTINPNQLTERQRRYRDTAYDIIYYALQHSKEGREFIKSKKQLQMILGNKNTAYGKKNKGIKHQAEKIYQILSELDDEFSANDGFLPEWGEFFNAPGVSYNNAEAGADAELALEAYDVIVENRYLYDTENVDEFGILTEEDAQKNQYELEALLDAYKNADDKTIPMLAYYEWFDRLHPYIQEDIEKKWESETNEIDRYQSLSKFEQAKEDLKLYAATLKGYGDYSSQFAEYARAVLKRLDFMTENDKARIFDKLKEYNSFRDIEKNLDTVMDFAETLADVSMRKQLAADIDREVRQTIHEWQNGIKKTKYTYPANKLFTRLRELNRMKIDTLQDMYDQIVNEEANITYEADTVNDNDYYKVIEEMFIKYRINGSYYNTTEFLKDLLDKIQNAKFTAKLARDEIDFERRMQNINLIDECARAVDTHKGKVSKLEQAYRHGFNLNSALEMMFNKEIKNKFTLDYLYAMKDAQVGADRNEVLEKIAKVFGYTGRFRDIQLFNRFIDMTKKEFKIKQRYTPDKVNGTYRVTHTDPETGKTFTDRVVNVRKDSYEYKEWDEEPVELSRMELLYYYIQSKNSISYKMLTDMGDETTPPKGQFDKFEFDQLLNELTEQEKMMGDILQMAAEKYYPQLNQYHIKKYHTDLGKVNAYFPRKSETQDVKMLEMFNQYSQLNTNQRMQKQRTAGPGIRIAPANPVAVLFDHIEKANTLIIMGEQLDIMNSVFKDSDLQKKIKTVWGDDTAKEFMQLVTANLYSGQQSTISEAESFIGKIENNVIKAQIFLKPQVGLKNVMSFMNYGVGDEYVSAGEWWKKFAQQTFTPKEWKNNINYMMNIPYLKDRFGRGGSTDALKRQLEQRMFAKISLFDEIFSANVRYGDMGAIILGGKPYIDCLLDKGYSEEQAIRIFIEKTVNDQQSSIPSTLSNIQRNAAHQPLAKMFFAYQNTPWQYFRTASNAIIRFKQNPSPKTGLDMLKLVGCYMFLFPYLFNLASSLSPIIAATGGGDDEFKEDFWKSIIGGVTFIPIAGMFINTIYSGFRGERATTGNWFDTAASKLGNAARKIRKDEITPKDLFFAISLFAEASTGIPMTTIGTETSGAFDLVTGSPLKGLLKLGGYTEYRAKRLTGETD